MKIRTLYCIAGLLFLFCRSLVCAETLHLVTEDYPPFNMRLSGENAGSSDDPLTGISTDIVRELFRRAGIGYTIRIYPWKRAYDMALRKPGYGVFSTTRTPEREPLFKWVGPLVPNDWILMAKKSRNIKINSLKDAHKYDIGGYKGDATSIFLKKKGFSLQYVRRDYLNARKLNLDRIDLWATGSLKGPYLAKKEGISGLEQVFLFKQTVLSIAFNLSVSDDKISKLNQGLRNMEADGTRDRIFRRYR